MSIAKLLFLFFNLVFRLTLLVLQSNCSSLLSEFPELSLFDEPEKVERYKEFLKNESRSFARKYRCVSMYHITLFDQRAICFTHIPKSGGTSVQNYMRTHYSDRYDYPRPPHEAYKAAEEQTKYTRLFATLFRHPVSRAVSLYHYIKSASLVAAISQNLGMKRLVWQHAHNTSMTFSDWIQDPEVMKLIKRNYFTSNGLVGKRIRSNFKSEINEPVTRKVKVYNITSATQHFLTALQKGIPDPRFQCSSQMKTLALLVNRYSAVGLLENIAQFWALLSTRAMLHMSLEDIHEASMYHHNEFNHKQLSASLSLSVASRGDVVNSRFTSAHLLLQAEERGRSLLYKALYCDIILWELVGTSMYIGL